jgi:hypothetical protein
MTATIPPMMFTWDGESFVPKHPRLADRHYVVGEDYRLIPHEERSTATHNHEFAWLKEAWMNLPEDLAMEYPTPEHLRKRALIEAGYYDETIVDTGSNAAALRVAAFVRSMDDFALVFVRGAYVVKRTAKSQSRRAMKKAEFQASKTAIMDIIAGMLGTDAATLQAARAA